MSSLDKFYDFTLNLPDAKLTSKAMSLCNIDRNVFNIYLTLQEGKNNPILNANLGDYTVTMIVVKPKTKEYVEKVGVIDGSNDRLLFELGETFNDQIGSYKGEIKVQSGDEVITSSSFAYSVTQSLISGLNAEIEANPDVEILRQLINEVKSVVGMTPEDPDSLLTNYQTKVDNTLTTTEKEIPKAINEVSSRIKEKANKEDVARISSGTPLFATDISKMTDITKNYVNTSDGYLYYYDGLNFIKSTVQYQSTGISEGSIELGCLSNTFEQISDYEVVYGDVVEGYYKNTDGNFNSNNGYRGATINCKPYEKYKITGIITGTTTSLVNFYDMNDNFLGHLVQGDGTTKNYEDYDVVIPQNCFKMTVNCHSSISKPIFKKMAIKNKITTANDVSFIDKSKNIFDKNNMVINNGFYSSKGVLTDSSLYKCFRINLKSNTTYTATITKHYIVYFDNNGNFLSYEKNSGELINNSTFKTPIGCTSVGINLDVNQDINEYMIVEGNTLPSDFISHELILDPTIKINANSVYGIKNMNGKKLMLFGDSITANQERYVNIMLSLTGLKLINNFAVSGSHWRNYKDTILDGNPINGTHSNTMCNQVQKLLNTYSSYDVPDIIIMSAGTNDDYYDETVIETQFTNSKEYIDVSLCDLTTFAGAFRWCVEKIYSVYPDVKIFIATQIQGNEKIRPFTWQKKKVAIIKELAERMSLPVIDAFSESRIYGIYENENTNGKYLIDGLHPNINGAKVLGEYYAKSIENTFKVSI